MVLSIRALLSVSAESEIMLFDIEINSTNGMNGDTIGIQDILVKAIRYAYTHTFTYMDIHIYVYNIYIYVCIYT
jgi:hypothetical protein